MLIASLHHKVTKYFLTLFSPCKKCKPVIIPSRRQQKTTHTHTHARARAHIVGPKTEKAGTNSGESGARDLEAESIRSRAESMGVVPFRLGL